MKSHRLENANSGEGWVDWDPFHLEVPNGRIEPKGERADACLEAYVWLTREGGAKKIAKFENAYSSKPEPLS